ncbi:hypothetical protein GCM10010329_02900 [Streptomyces spiroverticillatus]|uniref:Serine protease n=1 Tax=Streptomyces finlayi TaxID=67296 RepID=A0A919C6I7_9ACTN|nr:hypothetical protein GCM10010329_02900 [Streptomyces spiroverticillatus]GHC78007.1 hypothetical protein GCM10010334_02880 [Streptomyces finlayi]
MGPEAGQVRVLSPNGGLAGAGFLVAPDGSRLYVLTCAHVVTAVTGRTAAVGDGDGSDIVIVDLPGQGWSAEARVVEGSWSPTPLLDVQDPGHGAQNCGDFAALAVARGAPRLPDGCGPLPLAACGPPEGQSVLVRGYPGGLSDGVVATGSLVGTGGACPRWVQFEGTRATGAAFEGGFSGAAVWDPVRRAVIGLVTAAHNERDTKVAWMLPIEAAAGFWTPLGAALRPPEVRSCRPPAARAQRELVEALLDIPLIDQDSGRGLRMALPRAVRRNVSDQLPPFQHVQALTGGCFELSGGCPTLRRTVEELCGDTAATRKALAVLDRLCCGAAAGPGALPGAGHGTNGASATGTTPYAGDSPSVPVPPQAPAPEPPAPPPRQALSKYLVDAAVAVDSLQDDTTLRLLIEHFRVTVRFDWDRPVGHQRRLLVVQLMEGLCERTEGLAPLVEYLELRYEITPEIRKFKRAVAAWQVDLFTNTQWVELFELLELVEVPHLARRFVDFLRDLGHPPPVDCTEPWAVFLHACTLNSRPGESLPCFRVLRELLADGIEAAGERNALLAWARANDSAYVPQEELVPPLLDVEEPRDHPFWRPDGYLIVRLRPLLDAAPGSDALLSHWWRAPGGEQLRGPDRRIDLRDAEFEVRRLLRYVEDGDAYPSNADLAVEFLLPRQFLGLHVERWRKDALQGVEGVLGEDHHVVLRSLERINRPDLHDRWWRRWDAFVAGQAGRVHWFPEDGRPHLLSDPPPAVVVLSRPPQGGRSTQGERRELDELSEALRVGVPVVLWDRRGERDPAFRTALNQLLTEYDPRRLPELVRGLRTAVASSDAEEYFSVGRHVALLWDDPERMPVAHAGSPPPTTGEERL